MLGLGGVISKGGGGGGRFFSLLTTTKEKMALRYAHVSETDSLIIMESALSGKLKHFSSSTDPHPWYYWGKSSAEP